MAENIGRIGDHVTNIAEYVWFLVRDDALPPREKADGSTVATPWRRHARRGTTAGGTRVC